MLLKFKGSTSFVSHIFELYTVDANEYDHSTFSRSDQIDLVPSESDMVVDLVQSGSMMYVTDLSGSDVDPNGKMMDHKEDVILVKRFPVNDLRILKVVNYL